MKHLFFVFTLINSVSSDSTILGYQLSLTQASLSILHEAIVDNISTKTGARKDQEQQENDSQIQEENYSQPQEEDDISIAETVKIFCKIQGIWTIAKEQWILCLLSRYFAQMRLHYLVKPSPYDVPIPPIDHTNEKIFQMDAKYLEPFFQRYKVTLWTTLVFDVFYYSLQHIVLTTHSLLEQPFPNGSLISSPPLSPKSCTSLDPECTSPCSPMVPWTISFTQLTSPRPQDRSPNTYPLPDIWSSQKLSLPQSIYTIYHDICNTFHNILPTYVPILKYSGIASYLSTQGINDTIFLENEMPQEVSQLCQLIQNKSLSPYPFVSSTSSHPFPSIIQTFSHSHYSLFKEAHKALPSIYPTYHYFRDELYHIQNKLLSFILLEAPLHIVSPSLFAVQQFLAAIQSLNISIFSISVFCGSSIYPDLIDFTLHHNLFVFIDTTLMPVVARRDSMKTIMDRMKVDWLRTRVALMEQLKFLEKVANCALKAFKPLNAYNSEDFASDFPKRNGARISPVELLRKQSEKAKDIASSISDVTDLLSEKLSRMKEDRWRTYSAEWLKHKGDFRQQWIKLVSFTHQFALILDQSIDLEKLYIFPIDFFLKKGNRFWAIAQEGNDQSHSSEVTEDITNEEDNPFIDLINNALFSNDAEYSVKDDNECEFLTDVCVQKGEQNDSTMKGGQKKNTKEGTLTNVSVKRMVQRERRKRGGNKIPSSIKARMQSNIKRDNTALYKVESKQASLSINLEKHEWFTNPVRPKTAGIPLGPKRATSSPHRPLLPLHFTGEANQSNRVLLLNASISNKFSETFKQELQFWLLINHHPSEISSCFTYSRSESPRNEVFNSALSLPNSISLFVSNEPLSLAVPNLFAYGFIQKIRGRDERIATMNPFFKFLKLRERYNHLLRGRNHLIYRSSSQLDLYDDMHYIAQTDNSLKSYTNRIRFLYDHLSLSSLFSKAINAFAESIKASSSSMLFDSDDDLFLMYNFV